MERQQPDGKDLDQVVDAIVDATGQNLVCNAPPQAPLPREPLWERARRIGEAMLRRLGRAPKVTDTEKTVSEVMSEEERAEGLADLLEAGLRFDRGLLIHNSCTITNGEGEQKTLIIFVVETGEEIGESAREVGVSVILRTKQVGTRLDIDLYYSRDKKEWIADLCDQQIAWVNVQVCVTTPLTSSE